MVRHFFMHIPQMGIRAVVGCLLLMGCESLSAKDYIVMHEAFKNETVQAQLTAATLHMQVKALQEQLGAARSAQARFQGELRDAERRLSEAERLVDVKQQELVKANAERDQLAQAGRQVKVQLSETELLRRRTLGTDREQKRITALQLSIKKLTKEMAALNTIVRDSLLRSKPSRVSAYESVVRADQIQPRRGLIVKAGDTLSSIARRYAVALADLKNVNRLPTDRILVGQLLVVPEP
jgi:chromosome segregation ATPase